MPPGVEIVATDAVVCVPSVAETTMMEPSGAVPATVTFAWFADVTSWVTVERGRLAPSPW